MGGYSLRKDCDAIKPSLITLSLIRSSEAALLRLSNANFLISFPHFAVRMGRLMFADHRNTLTRSSIHDVTE